MAAGLLRCVWGAPGCGGAVRLALLFAPKTGIMNKVYTGVLWL